MEYPEQIPQQQYMPIGIQQPVKVPQEMEENFFKFRIDGSDILEELQHQLKGEIWTTLDNGQEGWKKVFERWVNDEGLNKILHVVYSEGLNKNIFLGNLTTEQINLRCFGLWKELALLLCFRHRYEKWGIKKENRGLLIKTIVHQVHSGLSRSEGGKEADQLSTAAQRSEIYHIGDNKTKSGTMLNPINWFRR